MQMFVTIIVYGSRESEKENGTFFNKKVLVLLAIESRYFDVNIVRFLCNFHLTKQNFKVTSSLIQAH